MKNKYKSNGYAIVNSNCPVCGHPVMNAGGARKIRRKKNSKKRKKSKRKRHRYKRNRYRSKKKH